MNEISESAVNAIINKDIETLKKLFCTQSDNTHDLKLEIEGLYDFVEGNIVSYGEITGFECGETVENGDTVRLNGCPEIIGVLTDSGKEYEIDVQIVLVFEKNKEWEGITQIIVHDTDTKNYYRIGEPFDSSVY